MNNNIIFVPYWIEKALSRNQHTLRDIIDYSVLRRYISQNDLSGLLGFQQVPEISKLTSGNSYNKKDAAISEAVGSHSLLSRWEESAGQRYKEELDSTVVPMSYSLEKETLERLKSNLDSADITGPTFKVIDIDKNSMVVVLYEGFLEEIKKPEVKYSLVKQLLMLSYVYCKVEQVAKTPLFSTYVDLLQLSTAGASAVATVE